MQIKPSGQVVETAREARAGERGPSMAVVLIVSTMLVIASFTGVYFVFLS